MLIQVLAEPKSYQVGDEEGQIIYGGKAGYGSSGVTKM
jgi:hypothetical protein